MATKVLVLTSGMLRRDQVSLIEDALSSGRMGPVPGGALAVSEVQRPDIGHYAQIRADLRSRKYDAVILLFKTERKVAEALKELDGASSVPIFTTSYAATKSHRGDRGVAWIGFEAA